MMMLTLSNGAGLLPKDILNVAPAIEKFVGRELPFTLRSRGVKV